MNIDEASGCFILRQRIDIVNAARAKAFSRLTVLFCAPDRLSGRDVIILNSDAIQRVCDEFMVANSELFALVQEYNRIARTCGMWICPYISRHLLSLNPLLACCRRYSR
ncbi:hypothetical protein LGN02_25680, partial [Escherichia coli]|nr:hypothetical protein [Escherichia coli]